MTISTQARKAKGRKLQQTVVAAVLDAHPSLTCDDVRSCAMGSHGDDVQLSAAGKAIWPFAVECKARAKIALVYDALEQADRGDDRTAIAVIKADRKKPLVVMSLEDFIGLTKA